MSQLTRGQTLTNPRTSNTARYEEAYKELSRLQRCPTVRRSSQDHKMANNSANLLSKILAFFTAPH
jgi:hypothetical protein